MSKVTDKLLNFMKLNDEEEYEDEEFFDDSEEEDSYEEPEKEKEPKKRNGFFGRITAQEKNVEEEKEEEQSAAPIREMTKRVNISPSRTSREVASSGKGEMVKVIRAQAFEEVRAMIDLLKEDKIVVINLEGIGVDVAQRIIDCVSGASYGVDGKLEGVNDSIFILAPKNVEITGDLKNKIANNSISTELNRY